MNQGGLAIHLAHLPRNRRLPPLASCMSPESQPSPPGDSDLSDGDEANLLVRLGSRDPADLAALYDRYGRVLFSLANRILQDLRECEEVVQDVFVSLWRNPTVYRPNVSSPLTFLTAITRNKCIDRMRKAGRRLPAGRETDDFVEIAAEDRASDPYRMAELEDLAVQVRVCLGHLPDPQRITIESAYFENLGVEEIAVRAELPSATVKSRLRLALDKLRRCLRHKPAA